MSSAPAKAAAEPGEQYGMFSVPVSILYYADYGVSSIRGVLMAPRVVMYPPSFASVSVLMAPRVVMYPPSLFNHFAVRHNFSNRSWGDETIPVDRSWYKETMPVHC